MRLNKNTYPAYIDLESARYDYLKIDEMFISMLNTDDKFRDFMKSIEFTYKQTNKCYYLTEPFKDAIKTATPKIMEGHKQLNEIPCDCGVIFTDKGFTVYFKSNLSAFITFVQALIKSFTKRSLLSSCA